MFWLVPDVEYRKWSHGLVLDFLVSNQNPSYLQAFTLWQLLETNTFLHICSWLNTNIILFFIRNFLKLDTSTWSQHTADE